MEFQKICITNRHLAIGPFLPTIESILQGKDRPDFLILREKDLTEDAYALLASEVLRLCGQYGTPCILHHFQDVAIRLGARVIHLSMPEFEHMPQQRKIQFDEVGVSIHSAQEAQKAQQLGASYVIAGHIFETDCKKGKEPRGLDFLREVCQSLTIPVYAIGGIHKGNAASCIQAGATGVCMMSGYMRRGR